ncbi:MAG: chorismate-binding protein [Pseudomonadota bacterium]
MRAWPWTTSTFAERGDLLALVDAAVHRYGVDAFLSGGARPLDRRWVVGVAPAGSLQLEAGTSRDAIRAFVDAGPGPVLGFLSYPYGLGATLGVHRDPGFPGGLLRRYHGVLEWDLDTGQLDICTDDAALGKILRDRAAAPPARTPHAVRRAGGPPTPSMDRAAYMAGVEETLEAIRDGLVYQLNLSIRYQVPFRPEGAWSLFRILFERYPASHYVYMDVGRHRLISTSPERFLRVRGDAVWSQPIKGTARVSPGADEVAIRAALQGSPKESAELSMIVDLIRNDVGRSCVHGSVAVPRHKDVFRVDDLLQMCSDVTGQLRPDRDAVDLLLDAFPGGSVTGCPKEAAMGLIDRLEGHPRDIYCGAFVLLRGLRDMDASIAIRTAVSDRETETLRFDAGSGIVVGSEPASEFLETTAKAAKFLEVLGS